MAVTTADGGMGTKVLAFIAMVAVLVGTVAVQIKQNRAPASDDEIEAAMNEGACERRVITRWVERGGESDVSLFDLQTARSACAQEREEEK